MLSIQFLSYNKRAIKPRAISESKMVYEVFNAHTLFMEDEARFILDTYTGIRVPPGYVAQVIPNPSIFWYTDLSTQGGNYFIEPGSLDSIKIFCIPIIDADGRIPGEGQPIALLKIVESTPFEITWNGAEPDHELIDLSKLN